MNNPFRLEYKAFLLSFLALFYLERSQDSRNQGLKGLLQETGVIAALIM